MWLLRESATGHKSPEDAADFSQEPAQARPPGVGTSLDAESADTDDGDEVLSHSQSCLMRGQAVPGSAEFAKRGGREVAARS